MFHEEKIIDGVLCWRGTPTGEWQQYTAESLTVALTTERGRARELERLAAKAVARLDSVRQALNAPEAP